MIRPFPHIHIQVFFFLSLGRPALVFSHYWYFFELKVFLDAFLPDRRMDCDCSCQPIICNSSGVPAFPLFHRLFLHISSKLNLLLEQTFNIY